MVLLLVYRLVGGPKGSSLVGLLVCLQDRFYGQEDPVAEKMLRRNSTQPELKPPEDATITSLYVGGLDDSINEPELRDIFYSFGEIATVRVVKRQNCAFIEYTTREAAEAAAKALHQNLVINGVSKGGSSSNSMIDAPFMTGMMWW